MMPRDRSYKHGNLKYSTVDKDRWSEFFDLTRIAVVYQPVDGETKTVISYHDTVSAAVAAAAASNNYKVAINWQHADITKKATLGPVTHRDATADLPSGIDSTA